jgi:hypothetical protein
MRSLLELLRQPQPAYILEFKLLQEMQHFRSLLPVATIESRQKTRLLQT